MASHLHPSFIPHPCIHPAFRRLPFFSLKKSIKSVFSISRIRFQVSVTSEGRVDEKGLESIIITLVLSRESDPEAFLGKFWEALKGRAWEEIKVSASGAEAGSCLGPGNGEGSVALRMPVVGVSWILRKEQEMWESTDKSLQDAFQDLNALTSKAKEMVMLAEKMRLKLLSGSNNQASGEAEGTKEEKQD